MAPRSGQFRGCCVRLGLVRPWCTGNPLWGNLPTYCSQRNVCHRRATSPYNGARGRVSSASNLPIYWSQGTCVMGGQPPYILEPGQVCRRRETSLYTGARARVSSAGKLLILKFVRLRSNSKIILVRRNSEQLTDEQPTDGRTAY